MKQKFKSNIIGILQHKITIKAIIIFLVFVAPSISLIPFMNRTIQIEDLIFLLVFFNVVYNTLLDGRLIFLCSTHLILVFSIIIMSFLSIISFFYTDAVLINQIKSLIYWILSLTPLMVINNQKTSLIKNRTIYFVLYASVLGTFPIIITKILATSLFFRSSGYIGDPNLAGELFTLASLLNLGMWFESKKKIYILAFVLTTFTVFVTGSRESILTLLSGLLIMSSLLLKLSKRYIVKLFFAIGAVAVIIIKTINSIAPDMLNRYLYTINILGSKNINEINIAAANRIIVWVEVINQIALNPIKPFGFEGIRTIGISGIYAHNMFLQSWVIGGIIGLGIFIIFLVCIINFCRIIINNKPTPVNLSILSIALGYCISGFVADHFFTFQIWNFIFFTILSEKLIESKVTKKVVLFNESNFNGSASQ